MSDQNNKSKTAIETPDTQAVSPTSKSPKNTLAIASIILVLLAAGFFQYRVESLIMKNSALEQSLSLLSNQNQTQLQQSAQQTEKLSNNDNQLSSMSTQLSFMQQSLNQIPGARLDDWKIAEVEYLLRLGNQRINLQHEVQGASALFDAANQILASLDDPALLIVREKIAEEMLLLGKTSEIDRQGLYTQLQALKNIVHNDIQPPSTFTQSKDNLISQDKTIQADETGQSEETEQAEENIDKSGIMGQLLALVSVRHRDRAFDAPLASQQYQLLEHSLILMLEQAQWALLKSDQALYESSLGNAQSWIENKLRHQQADNILEEIKRLKSNNIVATLPDVSNSLRVLRQIVQDRTYAPSTIEPIQNNTTDKEQPQAVNNTQKEVKKIEQEQV